jgi:hypothetical protein
MIRHYDPVVFAEKIYKVAIIKGPGRIAVQHDNRTSPALVKIGERMTVYGNFFRSKRIFYISKHVLRLFMVIMKNDNAAPY